MDDEKSEMDDEWFSSATAEIAAKMEMNYSARRIQDSLARLRAEIETSPVATQRRVAAAQSEFSIRDGLPRHMGGYSGTSATAKGANTAPVAPVNQNERISITAAIERLVGVARDADDPFVVAGDLIARVTDALSAVARDAMENSTNA